MAESKTIADAEALVPGFTLRAAWRLGDARIEADAIAFWNRLKILPQGADPAERAKQLVTVVYEGAEMVGVLSATIERVEQVRTRLAMIRSAVYPAHRRAQLLRALSWHARATLERWSRDNPHERLGGLGAIIESEELTDFARQPVWAPTRFILAGFLPDGRQLRISWFEDFRVDSY